MLRTPDAAGRSSITLDGDGELGDGALRPASLNVSREIDSRRRGSSVTVGENMARSRERVG
jgi:hypothetical protein